MTHTRKQARGLFTVVKDIDPGDEAVRVASAETWEIPLGKLDDFATARATRRTQHTAGPPSNAAASSRISTNCR